MPPAAELGVLAEPELRQETLAVENAPAEPFEVIPVTLAPATPPFREPFGFQTTCFRVPRKCTAAEANYDFHSG